MREELSKWILDRAYVPEHLPHYFAEISGARVALFKGKYVGYEDDVSLRLIGYPLEGEFNVEELEEVLTQYVRGKALVVVVGPQIPKLNYVETARDYYYYVELPVELNRELRYMVRRALREVDVRIGRELSKEHIRLVKEFLRRKNLPHVGEIYPRLPNYVKSCGQVFVISAYNRRGDLVGFDVVDLSARDYAFYMFNFVDRWNAYVPGTSDLLLYKLFELARERGKSRVNLGLGSSEGVRRFKEKWGARVLTVYEYGAYVSPLGVLSEFTKF